MHYKKRKLHKLHSIPIGLCNKENHKRLYLVSYSIPLSCMVVLLLGFSVMINPSSTLKTSAIEAGDIVDDGDVDNQSTVNQSNVNKDSIEDPVEGSSGGSVEGPNENSADSDSDPAGGSSGDYADELEGEMAANSDEGIMPLADTTPTVSLSIGGQGQSEVVDAGVGKTAYRSHTVSVVLSGVEEYFLRINGDSDLAAPAGGTALTGTGTTGVAGESIPAGQWGYGWDYTGNTTQENLLYKTVPSANTNLAGPSLSNNATSFNGRLAFAAKFPANATLGNYTSNVNLTLIATPKANTGLSYWRNASGTTTAYSAGTGTMQGISNGFCRNNSNISTGWTVDLVDNRDDTTYTIVKLGDKCWMGQNLSLTGPKTLAPGDTDLPAGMTWDLPASVGSGGTNTNNVNTSNTWDTSNSNVVQVRTGSDSGDNKLDSWLKGYGNYYSWPAATAGTGTTSVTSADASASICPKGWKLPSSSGTDSYSTLTGTKSGWTTATFNGNSGVYGYYFGSTATNIYKGANFWPAAGYVYQTSGALDNAGSHGLYWSRRAYSDNSDAYRLSFTSSSVNPTNYNGRYRGFSVRCVATY